MAVDGRFQVGIQNSSTFILDERRRAALAEVDEAKVCSTQSFSPFNLLTLFSSSRLSLQVLSVFTALLTIHSC